ncbi:MAG: OadG family protein [Treponema sp.]|uniref:OadG family protein n=1 Tax=Treponema sp. TaxID=166 RepID=UPI001B66828F|nr:OadG family protein [Treponema sp.]MBP5588219.1 OadG family protein [Treponema sp.]MBR0154464.1 OadG family protein [Treponema sp.]MCR5385704.1 OadG family protein [Treponema sp.]
MTIVDMLGQSGILTLLGMGVVFTFLIIMIICMYALHGILHALKMDVDAPEEKSASASAPAQDDKAVVAAIATALKK